MTSFFLPADDSALKACHAKCTDDVPLSFEDASSSDSSEEEDELNTAGVVYQYSENMRAANAQEAQASLLQMRATHEMLLSAARDNNHINLKIFELICLSLICDAPRFVMLLEYDNLKTDTSPFVQLMSECPPAIAPKKIKLFTPIVLDKRERMLEELVNAGEVSCRALHGERPVRPSLTHELMHTTRIQFARELMSRIELLEYAARLHDVKSAESHKRSIACERMRALTFFTNFDIKLLAASHPSLDTDETVCGFCSENYTPGTDTRHERITLGCCGHNQSICKTCFGKHAYVSSEGGTHQTVKCPFCRAPHAIYPSDPRQTN